MTEYTEAYLGQSRAQNTELAAPVSINRNVPNISVRQDSGLPVNAELLSRSFDIKKQLSQSFHGGGVQGGVSKPHSRRNSAYHVKLEPDEDEDEQGNERKRRDNINERIQDLLGLIPPEYFQDNGKDVNVTGYEESMAKSTGTKDGKPNKGQVLSKSVEYIQALQNKIDENNRKEVELQLKLKTLQMKQQGKTNVPILAGSTSAELALGEIGVGPHAEMYFKDVLLGVSNRRT